VHSGSACARLVQGAARDNQPIIGPRTMEQLEDNLGAASVEITEGDRERLGEVTPPRRATVPYYETDFGPHRYCW
jgi:hypothetical protein